MGGFIQEFEINTLAVTVWHILEFDHYKLEPLSNGQFHEGDTYVVRWEYRIIATGKIYLFYLICIRIFFVYHLL